jgi:enolase
MAKIQSVSAREVLDSRGNPTIEVICTLESGAVSSASVPSGASTGIHEAVELRDNDKNRFNGLGVLQAVKNVNIEINDNIKDIEWSQKTLDEALIKLDGTKNKSNLGANAILGVSMAFARAKAQEENLELFEYLGSLAGNKDFKIPQPMFNIINGGRHADSGLEIQEFMIIPEAFNTIAQKVRAGVEIIFQLRKDLQKDGYAISLGDEGGFAPRLSSNEEAFQYMENAVKEAGYSKEQIKFGIDAAASEFFKEDKYEIKIHGENKKLTSAEMIDWYEEIAGTYPLISIEDGLSEDDWNGFSEMTKRLGSKVKVIGDDLTVTNTERIKIAAEKKSINAVLIKLNQIGTVTETIEAIELTKKENWAVIISHRSGETDDTFIADLAVGLSCDYIKAGSLAREERVCKYNRLMAIEDILQKRSK